VRRYLEGDPEAAAMLSQWVRLGSWSFRRRLGDDWEDAVADAVLQVTEALQAGRFTGSGPLRGYVRRIASTTCLDRLRHHRRWRMVELEDEVVPPVRRSPADVLEAAESWRLMARVLGELSVDCVRLLRQVAAGLSYREMAASSEGSEGALRVRVLRCRRRASEIRDRLERNESGVRTPESGRGGRS